MRSARTAGLVIGAIAVLCASSLHAHQAGEEIKPDRPSNLFSIPPALLNVWGTLEARHQRVDQSELAHREMHGDIDKSSPAEVIARSNPLAGLNPRPDSATMEPPVGRQLR